MLAAIPDITAATAPESHGLGWSWARCAAAIAAARRPIVTGRKPRSASAARNAATVAGVAGIARSPRSAHQPANSRQSRSYALSVAGASARGRVVLGARELESSAAGANGRMTAGR